MAQSINLIPQKEVSIQRERKALNVSTTVSILMLTITLVVFGVMIYKRNNITKEIIAADSRIDSSRKDIKSMTEMEILARNLNKKYKELKKHFEDRVYYSVLLEDVALRTPDTVFITSLTVRESVRLSISGKADNYLSVADFTNRLIDQEFEGGMKSLITAVTLKSVRLENQAGIVEFTAEADFDPEILRK